MILFMNVDIHKPSRFVLELLVPIQSFIGLNKKNDCWVCLTKRFSACRPDVCQSFVPRLTAFISVLAQFVYIVKNYVLPAMFGVAGVPG